MSRKRPDDRHMSQYVRSHKASLIRRICCARDCESLWSRIAKDALREGVTGGSFVLLPLSFHHIFNSFIPTTRSRLWTTTHIASVGTLTPTVVRHSILVRIVGRLLVSLTQPGINPTIALFKDKRVAAVTVAASNCITA